MALDDFGLKFPDPPKSNKKREQFTVIVCLIVEGVEGSGLLESDIEDYLEEKTQDLQEDLDLEIKNATLVVQKRKEDR